MPNLCILLLATENAIVTNNGWENYIDLESWVDWFIVTELTFNMESAYYRSCYLWKRDGGKLSEQEIREMTAAYTAGEIPDYQVAALCMAIYFRGMK